MGNFDRCFLNFSWALSFEWLYSGFMSFVFEAIAFEVLGAAVQKLTQKLGSVGLVIAKLRALKQFDTEK